MRIAALRSVLQKLALGVITFSLLFGLIPSQAIVHADVKGCPNGMSQLDCAAILGPWENWIPESSGGDCSTTTDDGSGAQEIEGANNAEKIWNFFIGQGLTPIATAGIMGNFHQEDSAFDPAEKQNRTMRPIPDNGDGVTGFGIAQWTSPKERQAGLFAKLREANLGKYYGAGWGDPEKDKEIPAADIDSMLTIELNYAWGGDTTKVSDIADQLNAATSVSGDNGSTVLFHHLFERSDDNAAQIKERVDDAGKFLQQFGNTSAESCAGELGGVSSVDDAIAWADRFYNETQQTYHSGGNKLDGPRSTAITELYHMVDNGKTCWGGAADCSQCTALTGWFVTQLTDYPYGGGDGGVVVDNMAAKGVPTGTEPRPFSVFSYDTGSFGHTGLVLGTLDNGVVITLENNWPTGTLSVRQYNIKADYPKAKFAYVGDKLKVAGVDTSQSGGPQ